MKLITIYIACIYCLICNISFAQTNYAVRQTSNVQNNFPTQIIINQVDGRPMKQKFVDVIGSPYLNEKFALTDFIMIDGQSFKNVKAKLDICDNELHLINEKNELVFLYSTQVKEVTYNDTLNDLNIQKHKVVSGLPSIDDLNEKNFYEVLSDGKVKLVKLLQKKVDVKKNELTGETTKEFEFYDNLFIVKNTTIKRVKKDKKFLLEVFNDKTNQINNYLNINKVSIKDYDSMVAVFNYYNSL